MGDYIALIDIIPEEKDVDFDELGKIKECASRYF